MSEHESIDLRELVQLCATDSLLFSKTFFPKAYRQPFATFHRPMWDKLENPANRRVNLQMFRGSSKTTCIRTFAAKRIAYGISHTVLVIGKSQEHAINSVEWLRKQVRFNRLFADTFRLTPGAKWAGPKSEVIHGIDEYPIWLLAMGIDGSIRGLNLDDRRPDLILIDDICDEENSASAEQRKKIDDLVYGALWESLTPASEEPEAKMVMAQTPLHREDVSTKALSDPGWTSARYGCWTPETEHLPLEMRRSAWEDRWSSAELRAEKIAAIARNKLSIFTREKECRLTSPETSAFLPEWVQYYQGIPPNMVHYLWVDPVPPPSPQAVAKGLHNNDYEAMAIVGMYKGDFYLREVSVNRGHEPSWTMMEFFRLARKYKIRKALVESVAYQRTLAWLLRQGMKQQRTYYQLEEVTDKRSKFNRIIDGLNGPCSNATFFVPENDSPCGMLHSEGMAQFLSQFAEYPNSSNDDALEAVACCVAALAGQFVLGDDDEPEDDEDERKKAPLLLGRDLAP